MESIFKADVFFFITGIAVIVVGSALAALVVYLTLIARDIRYIVKRARGAADGFARDIELIRANRVFAWILEKFGVRDKQDKKVVRPKQQK